MWEKAQSIFVQSLERAVTAMARVAPGLLALLAVFVASMFAALLVRVALHRLCARVELDRWAVRWGLASAAPGRATPSAVVTRLGAGSVLAFGFLLGLAIFDAAADTALTSRAADYAPHVLAAAIIAIAGVALARALERQLLIGAVNLGLQHAGLVAGTARWIVLATAAAMVLEHLGVGGNVLPILFGILAAGVSLGLALAFGLGARDAVAKGLERRATPPEPKAGRASDDVQHM